MVVVYNKYFRSVAHAMTPSHISVPFIGLHDSDLERKCTLVK